MILHYAICRQVAGSFSVVFNMDWPNVIQQIWLFIGTIVQIDFIRFPVSHASHFYKPLSL
jgi:hypothetical protein